MTVTFRVIGKVVLIAVMLSSTASATTPTCSADHCPDLSGQVVSYTFPLSLGCDTPLQGDFTITVCVRNEGDAPAGPFHVSADGHFFDEFDVDGLSAGVQDCQIRSLLTIGGYGVLNVDSRNEVTESNEDNNSDGFFVASLSATPSCTRSATPTPTPTAQVSCTPPPCRPEEVFYCPGDCPGGCGTQCATPTPTWFPQCDFSPVPSAGPPGTFVSLSGICYPIHSGRTARVYFDSILMATVHGDTGGDYSAGFTIPQQAAIGDHRVTLVMSNGILLATATFTVVSSCHGDCNGDTQVTIDELTTMVNIALNGTSDAMLCPGIDLWCNFTLGVTVDCIVAAVNNALDDCHISGLGRPCGGFVMAPKECAPGLVCQLPAVPDLPGVCVGAPTPTPTWSDPINLTPRTKFGKTAQWQPWSAATPDGKTLWAAYYDRSYGNCEVQGCNDITLARIDRPASHGPAVSYSRLTTASMPNLLPSNNPVEAGFLGDYMWVTVGANGNPYVVWSDTRGLNGAVEEDIYFASPQVSQH